MRVVAEQVLTMVVLLVREAQEAAVLDQQQDLLRVLRVQPILAAEAEAVVLQRRLHSLLVATAVPV